MVRKLYTLLHKIFVFLIMFPFNNYIHLYYFMVSKYCITVELVMIHNIYFNKERYNHLIPLTASCFIHSFRITFLIFEIKLLIALLI